MLLFTYQATLAPLKVKPLAAHWQLRRILCLSSCQSIRQDGKVGRKPVERCIRTESLPYDIMQPAFEEMHYQPDKRKFADRFPVTGACVVSCGRFLIAIRIPATHQNHSSSTRH